MRAPSLDTHTRSSQAGLRQNPCSPEHYDPHPDQPRSRQVVKKSGSKHDIYSFSFWTGYLNETVSTTGLSDRRSDLPEAYFIFKNLMSLVWRSPTARCLLEFASKSQWRMDTAALDDGAYFLDLESRTIILNDHGLRHEALLASGYFRHSFLLALMRGLRDIWHMECRQPNLQGYRIQDVLLLERVRTADCDIIAQMIAWELRSDGAADLWRHLIGSPEGDMALSFMRRLERYPAAAFTPSHLVYSFREWFEDKARVDACDHLALDMIDEDLSDPEMAGFYGETRLSAEFIESLSRLPGGQHYLDGYGDVILNERLFAGLHNDVNRAHFDQISRELNMTLIGNVAFRDKDLAGKIFPVNAESVEV